VLDAPSSFLLLLFLRWRWSFRCPAGPSNLTGNRLTYKRTCDESAIIGLCPPVDRGLPHRPIEVLFRRVRADDPKNGL
jgi:hypothetical protein